MDDDYRKASGRAEVTRKPGTNPAIKTRREVQDFAPSPGIQFVRGASDPTTPGRLVLSNYFAPALLECKLWLTRPGLELVRVDTIDWVSGLDGKKFRLFPEELGGSDAKRGSDVVVVSKGELLISQNSSRDSLYHLKQVDGTWTLSGTIMLQGTEPGYIQSFIMYQDNILVYKSEEHLGARDNWLERYTMDGRRLPCNLWCPPDNGWFYMGECVNGLPTFITGRQYGGELLLGIYQNGNLLIQDVTGSDVLFPFAGENCYDAFVVSYGECEGDFGAPSRFTHVPESALRR